jgi:hypothetical protein
VENFKNSNSKFLRAFDRTPGRQNRRQIVITVVITVAVRPAPVAMLLGDAAVEPSSPCPDPSHEKRREEENCAQGPLPVVLLLCTLPTAMPSPAPTHSPRQHRPTALRGRASTLPACPRGRRARCCSMRTARAPEPGSFWTPSPSSLRPINTPADQTERLAPSPATSQTHSPLPSRPSSTSPAPPATYWTRRAP